MGKLRPSRERLSLSAHSGTRSPARSPELRGPRPGTSTRRCDCCFPLPLPSPLRARVRHKGSEAVGSQQVVTPALKRERREVTPRAKNPKPLRVYKKPRKRRRTRKSDRRGGVNRKVCKYLALEAGKDSAHAVPRLEEESLPDSAFTLDHCYLSYNEADKTESSPMSRVNEIIASWSEQIKEFQEAPPVRPEGPASPSEEDSDSTWTPCQRAKAPQGPQPKRQKKQKQKKKRAGRRARRPPASGEKRTHGSPPLPLKKKCVNGFIMFCRLNRKHFIRTCPGMASTAATRELAQLWRMMTKQERKPYWYVLIWATVNNGISMKARRFSRLNNRIVRDDFSSGDEEPEPPKPFHLLLAEKSIPSIQTMGNTSLLGCIP
ncbi:basic helix-loop-helix and HMG box domain-containing protein 1 [Crotalus adamanteus]|uniref:Basic helix-loop-helix and HMG box domain-containing protein 1 n=1 Tax=Crotalus adamanteus TaxID=8729 RepID=A0AAW1AX22_CROAD